MVGVGEGSAWPLETFLKLEGGLEDFGGVVSEFVLEEDNAERVAERDKLFATGPELLRSVEEQRGSFGVEEADEALGVANGALLSHF